MSVADTSLGAYRTKVVPKMTKKEEIVYQAVELLQPCTNDDISAYLRWPINCVTGRTNGLEKKSLVKRLDKNGKTIMGNRAYRWVAIHPSDRQLSFLTEDCED